MIGRKRLSRRLHSNIETFSRTFVGKVCFLCKSASFLIRKLFVFCFFKNKLINNGFNCSIYIQDFGEELRVILVKDERNQKKQRNKEQRNAPRHCDQNGWRARTPRCRVLSTLLNPSDISNKEFTKSFSVLPGIWMGFEGANLIGVRRVDIVLDCICN